MLALDIWAGNTKFAKDFKKLNPDIKTIFCGDPIFQKPEYDLAQSFLFNMNVFVSRCAKILTHEEIHDVIEQSKTWVFKIVAEYKKIPIKDNSLDVVTLNSPHPLIYPGKAWFDEFARVLKPGWVFYFGHSREIYVDFWNEMFESISSGYFLFGKHDIISIDWLRFPMSPVMKSNFDAKELLAKWYIKNTPWYLYGTGEFKIPIVPSWKAWRKV